MFAAALITIVVCAIWESWIPKLGGVMSPVMSVTFPVLRIALRFEGIDYFHEALAFSNEQQSTIICRVGGFQASL
jgi:hypothetical protein